MFEVAHDLRATVRSFLRRPTSPLVAVAILSLGLAAAIAVITYVNGFYQPFPGVDADGLVMIHGVEAEEPFQQISYPDFLDYAAACVAPDAPGGSGAFEGLAAVQPFFAASVRLEKTTEVAFLEAVSGGFFSVLGVETRLGRGLAPADDRPEADPVAVLSYRWWQRTFAGDPAVIGSTVYLNNRPFTVVGVASPAFQGSVSGFRPDVWIPVAPFRDRYTRWAARAENRDEPLVRVYGRLRPGFGEKQAQTELAAVTARLEQ
ncbi:MAG: hypothetical protein HC897_15610, partial [Thermoanaerobaculia bacterium]|nr:hypothetical protein [Thermoanaerobaculia bacterium]